ncbi:MAG: N-acetyltransferase [Bacteroidales bacterium]|nr:N-acetyltransferase [Bacteroidales bacterium]
MLPESSDSTRRIRPAVPEDIPAILAVMEAAKGIMRASGNLHQWGEGYPAAEHLLADMAREGAFVIEEPGDIAGYFAFLASPEPTYDRIYGGAWLNDSLPYHVVHRIASRPEIHGIFQDIMAFSFAHDTNIRIDTHRDNRIMQHNILKHGFTYCGIILLANGDERLAYQRLLR